MKSTRALQNPLVFKGFKGRYNYWMGGGIVLIVGIVCTGILVNKRQKSGVHSKTRIKGFIHFNPVHNKFARRTLNK
jgi:uncharacterized membrane protein YhaH (DUF805 family)